MLKALIFSILYFSFFFFVYQNMERILESFDKIAKNKKKKDLYNINDKNLSYGVIALLIFATIIKLFIAPYFAGYNVDIATYTSWMDKAARGLNNFYSADYFCDYPPLFIMLFGAIGVIKNFFISIFQNKQYFEVFFIKLPAIIFDGLIAYEIMKIFNKYYKKSSHFSFALFLVIFPSVFYTSVVWGQTDSIFAYFLILTFNLALEDKLEMSALFFTISALLKPQSFLFAPILVVLFLKSKNIIFLKNKNLPNIYRMALNLILPFVFAIVIFGIAIMPFRNGVPDLYFLFQNYIKTFSSYPYATLNTFNLFNALGGNFANINSNFLFLSFNAWGTIFITLSVLFGMLATYLIKDKNKIYLILATYLLTIVMLGAKMHERYWYAVMIFGLIYFVISGKKKYFAIFTTLGISFFVNMHYALLLLNKSKDTLLTPYMTIFTIVNLSLMVYLIYSTAQGTAAQWDGSSVFLGNSENNTKEPSPCVKWDVIFIICLTLVFGIAAFYNLGTTKSPQTFVTLSKGEEIKFEFAKEEKISKVKYFIGHGLREYELSYSTNDIDYIFVSFDDKFVNTPSVFTWQSDTLTNVPAKYFKTKSTNKSNEQSSQYGDIAFYNENNELIPYTAITTAKNEKLSNLSDEYATIPDYPSWENSFYFDEIYHGRTAYEYKEGLLIYETTHPPLGKLLISVGINIFGATMFGFRFMGTLFGVLMVPLFFLFSKKLFKNNITVYLTTIIFTFDFMHLSHTRIASIDSFLVFFIIGAYYFMTSFYESILENELNKKTILFLALSGIFFGFSASVKWTGVYAGFGLLAIYIYTLVSYHKKYNLSKNIIKLISFSALFYIAFPMLIYYFSYLNYFKGFAQEFNLVNFINAQKSMFSYHSKLTATHPYSSPWFEWLLDVRPLWMYTASHIAKGASFTKTIVTMGNPLVVWGGLSAIIYTIVKLFKNRKISLPIAIILAGFFSQIMPWIFVSRVTFMYHYFPIIPFIVLAIGYFIEKYITMVTLKKLILPITYTAFVIILFIMYYPVLTGSPIDKSYLEWLKILPKWVF
jgi:Gpi18-like mannosyltransferase